MSYSSAFPSVFPARVICFFCENHKTNHNKLFNNRPIPQTASVGFPVFCFTSATGASTEIKDGENLQMSVDTRASFHCCLWLARARNESEALLWTQCDDQRPRRSIKRKKHGKKSCRRAQTSTLGKFKWLKGSQCNPLHRPAAHYAPCPTIGPHHFL